MSEQSESMKGKFIRLQNLLASEGKAEGIGEQTANTLQLLAQHLLNTPLHDNPALHHEVYEELRDTVKSVLSFLENHKHKSAHPDPRANSLLQNLLLAISHFCSAYYCLYHPIGCGEMIREFLSSDCPFFIPEYPSAAPAHPSPNPPKQETQPKPLWVWTKESSFKTDFFCQCIQTIMLNLCKFDQKLSQMKLVVIGQYLRLLYYMDDYIYNDKILLLCVGHVESLQKLFANPTKDTMFNASKQSLDEIIDYLTKLLRCCKNDDIKRRVQLLGALLGMSMLKLPSIEKKLVGCKILSKYSYEIFYRNTIYLSEVFYSEWVVKQNFFQMIFEDHCQASLIKASEDTFKLLVKRGLIDKEKFQKFFEILEKADHDLRKAMFRLIEPFRVDYHQVESMLEIFKNIRGVQFYDDEFFYFIEGLSRYSTETQLGKMLLIVEMIITQNYSKFQSYLTRRRAVECYAYVFEKQIIYKDLELRLKAYSQVAALFLSDPSENRLIMLKSLFENITETKMDSYYQQRLAIIVIDELNFIQKSFPLFKSYLKNKDDLVSFIKVVLKKYKKISNKSGFSREILREGVDFPEIFEEMLDLTKDSELQGLLNELADLTALKDFQFCCIKWVFLRLNWKHIKPIKKQYTDVIATNVTVDNPAEFNGLETVKYLIFNSEREMIRRGACELLVEVYTNLSDDFREEGEVYLIEFMQSVVEQMDHRFKEFEQGKSQLVSVLGTLELMEELMLNTEYFGVGSLRAHNSQVPTSTTLLKVYNNVTYGDDVLKIFEKKFPSNKTLFDVILQVAKQFKIGPLDITLEYQSNFPIKHNGLTLEQLKLNKQELNAIRLSQSRLKKQPLLVDGELSSKAKVAFGEMFKRFAPTGKMGKKECGDYIEGVTQGFCPIFDNRISTLFAEYDLDRDDILTLEDFLRFYKDCLLDPEKAEVVDKNLANLRFRRDLKTFDGDLDSLNEQVLFRFHIWKHKEIYEHLFKLSHHSQGKLAGLSQKLLHRLPTYSKISESLTDSLELKNKNAFEIEYMLTALQSQLTNQVTTSAKFIESKNHLAIFEYLSILSAKQFRLSNDENCLIICLHILRSLLGFSNLKDISLKEFPQLSFGLPQTDAFIQIIRESIKAGDSTLLEPAFALQLTQDDLPLQWIEQSAFSRDKDTRVLTCNFLFIWLLHSKSKDLNLFNIPIGPNNNEEWFNLLTDITRMSNYQIDYHQIFLSKIKVLQNSEQKLEGNRFNPIIHGSLKIIKEIYWKLNEQERNILNETLNKVLPKLISNQNRQFAYDLRYFDYPEQLLSDLQSVANVKIGKQIQPRNKYVGIRNLGCICYMNSILQQFFMIRQFYDLVMCLESTSEETEVNGVKMIDDFLAQLQEMYIHLEWTQKQYYDPTKFCLTVKDYQGKPINTNIQEDAHEFLNTAFGKMEEYAKKQEKLSILENIFGGKSVTEIICLTCKNKIQVLEHFYHLSVEVKGMKTLKQSFDKLIQPQEISDYFCKDCNKRVEKITKQMLIKQSPQILIINLQRITFDLQTFLKVKVHTKLQFEQTLDLHSYFSSSSKPAPYSLKGVVIHSGTSQGGHYYSLIKQDGKWFKFNDQSVTFFNESDLGREAFGGEEVTDQWGDHTSSTNAYILFYEKVNDNAEEVSQQNAVVAKSHLIEKVQKENEQFKHQLQFNQPSFFNALHHLFRRNMLNPQQNSELLSRISAIYFKVIDHLSINSDVKSQTINQIKDNVMQLLEALPEKAVLFLQNLKVETYKQILCVNNDAGIRTVYQKVLVKAISLGLKSGGENESQAIAILRSLLALLSDDMLLKNTHKSYQYFDFWKEIIGLEKVKNLLLELNALELFLDLLLGSESVLASKDKKRCDIHSSQAIPIIPIINALFSHKTNLLGLPPKDNSIALTQTEKKILNDSNFYRKMMKNKFDCGLLAPIISLLSFRDENYSKFIVEVLLKAMNSSDEIEQKSVVFSNIKAFLLVEDQFSLERMKWTLGIPQLDSIRFSEHEFGMMTSSQSKVYSYVSPLLFIKQEKYMPLLSTLYEKRKYFNSFSAYGILSFLELLVQSPAILQYIISLPAPNYLSKSYVDWIETYALKVSVEEHYSLPMEKTVLSQKLQTLITAYKDKARLLPQFDKLPVNKWIIGKNASYTLIDNLYHPDYQIELWQHETYILKNHPYGMGNFFLPDEEFSFSGGLSTSRSKYFLKCFDEPLGPSPDLQTDKTILTLIVKTSIGLTLHFSHPTFNHNITLKKGEHSLNCPFTATPLHLLLTISQGEREAEKQLQIKLNPVATVHYDGFTTVPDARSFGAGADFGFYDQINCKECTYLNVGRERCEMCDTQLFK